MSCQLDYLELELASLLELVEEVLVGLLQLLYVFLVFLG